MTIKYPNARTHAGPLRVSIVTGKVTRGRRRGVCGDCWRSSGLAGDYCDRFRCPTHKARASDTLCGTSAQHWESRS